MLANSGTFSYNGVAWTSLYKSKAEVKPIRDSAGRALVAREYTLDVEGYIAADPGSTTDSTLASMRQLLEKPGGALSFTDKGFGTLQVNQPGGRVRDAAYGPWPEVLSWQPVGNDQGCLVRWRCTTRVPCEEAPTPKGIIEWCWSESWDIDADGYTKRTIDGHLVVEATRTAVNNRTIPDNADAYRDKIVPELPAGFRRTQHYQLSEDKRQLKYRIDDEEIPYPLPEGLSRADVHQRVRWDLRFNAGIIRQTISGTVTVPARTPKTLAWQKILLILASRLSKDRAAAGARAAEKSLRDMNWKVGNPGVLVIENMEVDDDLFGRSLSFSCSASMFGVTLDQLVQSSGLFDKVPGADFGKWKTSLSRSAFGSRGVAGLGFLNGDDAIVDLCGGQTVLRAGKVPPPRLLKGKLKPGPNGADPIPPARSWIVYRCKLELVEDDRVVRHKPLNQPTPPQPVNPGANYLRNDRSLRLQGFTRQGSTAGGNRLLNSITTDAGGAARATGPQGAGVVSSAPDMVQRVSSPNYRLVLSGWAVRAGYEIPTPRVDSVGGVKVTQAHQHVAQEEVATIGGVPIYLAEWRIEYLLPDNPNRGLPVPVNPALP
jgi:hypothetical protein